MAEQRVVVLGADHAGFALKAALTKWLEKQGYGVDDVGTRSEESVDYPDYAHAVANAVRAKPGSLGILVCGTGVGMSIAANRHQGVRAACCSDIFSAKMARAHNDANVLCLGQRVVGEGLAIELVQAFLETKFDAEHPRHAKRVAKIDPR